MMRYKLLGGSGLRVSEICLGAMTFGETRGWGADAEEAGKILASYADAGGNIIDMAPNYSGGAAEEIVGAFVSGQRDRFLLSTKYTASNDKNVLAGGNSRRAMVRSVEASLKRLGTDYIDLFWLHYWDGTTPLEEILHTLDDLVTAGKVLYTGLSDMPAWLVSRAVTMAQLHGWNVPIAVQLEYNAASRGVENDFLPMAQALDMGVLCWGPLAAGALHGGSNPARRKAEEVPPAIAVVAEKLSILAAEFGLPPGALALQWLLHHPRYVNLVPIVGARTAEQLSAGFTALTQPLDCGLIAQVDALAAPAPVFPNTLIESFYLRKLATGGNDILPPAKPRC